MSPSPAPPPGAPSPRTRVRRLPARGAYDRETVHAILDEGLVAHVGFVADGQPYVIPTLYGRSGRLLYLHGSAASRMLVGLEGGLPVCLTVTLLDGLVLARSAFHHSANYRSVVVLGRASPVADPAAKTVALRVISEHVAPGRWEAVRPPDPRELAATSVLALPLDEASAKVRAGPPVDEAEDLALPVWAGVLPLSLTPGQPLADGAGVAAELPEHVRRWPRR